MAETKTIKTKSESIYIALDSDVLRNLSVMDVLVKNNGGVIDQVAFYNQLLKAGDKVLAQNVNFISEVYNLVCQSVSEEYPLFKFLVTETVWQETRHLPNVVDFIKNYCYVPNINTLNMDKKLEEKHRLAQAYCFGLYDLDGREVCPPPMQKYKKGLQLIPSNDAYIMAEATREGAAVLTMNGQDYVFDKNGAIGNKNRKCGIMAINEKLGYGKIVGGKMLLPEPFTLDKFCPLVARAGRNIRLLFADDSEKVRAGELG